MFLKDISGVKWSYDLSSSGNSFLHLVTGKLTTEAGLSNIQLWEMFSKTYFAFHLDASWSIDCRFRLL